jgi:HPt (histidine-containing phosphotransfer) domain-containing protein
VLNLITSGVDGLIGDKVTEIKTNTSQATGPDNYLEAPQLALNKAIQIFWCTDSLEVLVRSSSSDLPINYVQSLQHLKTMFENRAPVLLVPSTITLIFASLDIVKNTLWNKPTEFLENIKSVFILHSNNPSDEDLTRALGSEVIDVVPLNFALQNFDSILMRHFGKYVKSALQSNGKIPSVDFEGAVFRMRADLEFFNELLVSFLEELPRRRTEIINRWPGEHLQLNHLCHSLKGLALTFGLSNLAEAANAIELLAKQGSSGLSSVLLDRIEGEIQSAHYQIKRWLLLPASSS